MTSSPERPEPTVVVARLAAKEFPDAHVVLVSGSVIAGRGTATSDLDVVVVQETDDVPYRRSLTFEGWPVEVFVHSRGTMEEFFAKDVREGRPSMLRIWSEGVLVVDFYGQGAELQQVAREMFDRGYPAPAQRTLDKLRYQVTDLLEDLEGDPSGEESLFIAPTLGMALCHLRLLTAGRWVGRGKWLLREARSFDQVWTDRLVAAIRSHERGDADPLIRLTDETLTKLGGRLFDGFHDSWDDG